MSKYEQFRKHHISYLKICNNEISLGGGELSISPENFVLCSSPSNSFNYLVFFDSRGATVDQDGAQTTIRLLKDYFKSINASYLIISKPLYLTVIPTLLSFCESATFTFENIITNVGFVDTTPKKQDTLLDLRSQLDYANIDYLYQYLCNYVLSNGSNEKLGTLSITRDGILNISKRLSKIKSRLFFINSPEIIDNTSFERKRPKCFFPQIINSNELVNRVFFGANGCLIDISSAGIATYDGVHYTEREHHICFSAILSHID